MKFKAGFENTLIKLKCRQNKKKVFGNSLISQNVNELLFTENAVL